MGRRLTAISALLASDVSFFPQGLKKLNKYRAQADAQAAREARLKGLRGSTTFTGPKAGGGSGKEDGDDVDLEGGGSEGSFQGDVELQPWTSSEPPKPREGWMEKKTGREKSGGGWQNRYFVVRVPGQLLHFKKQDMAGMPLGILDLGKVLNVTLHASKEGIVDATRINVDTTEGTLKLRCRTEESALEWRCVPLTFCHCDPPSPPWALVHALLTLCARSPHPSRPPFSPSLQGRSPAMEAVHPGPSYGRRRWLTPQPSRRHAPGVRHLQGGRGRAGFRHSLFLLFGGT